MKKTIIVILMAIMGISANAQQYPRCIIPGDYPDPSILRDGKDFYMTHSPFQMGPAFLIWHSTDLQHWEPICRASNEKIWAMAPDLVKCNGKYYIYYPQGGSNWVIWADNIRGPWSKPIDLKTRGIDPGHLQMPDGKRYLYTSEGYVVKLTDDGLSTDGEPQQIYDGWDFPDDWETECMCLESPKMTYHNGYVYLTSAEGGTAGPPTSHMVVSARSKSPFGPWENSPYNPIVHTYSKDEPWWSKGHGSLVDDTDGNWWIVYHAYKNGLHTMGRQTLIEPIEWTEDGWFRSKATKGGDRKTNVNIQPTDQSWISDSFSSDSPGLQWSYWGTYDPSSIKTESGKLVMTGRGKTVDKGTLLSVTAPDDTYEVKVDVALGEGMNTAGLLLYYNGSAYAGVTANSDYLYIYSNAGNRIELRNKSGKNFTACLRFDHNRLDILISNDGNNWDVLQKGVDVSALNHNNYMGFYALRPTLVSYGEGEARFDNFVYKN